MTRNIGSIDRWIRAILGLAILSLAFFGPKTAWGLLGVIPLATALFNVCPLYSLLGIASDRRNRHSGTAAT
ncbi:MAG: DUF2892 domain-containing protein [Gemmatimonadaceae bacterium]